MKIGSHYAPFVPPAAQAAAQNPLGGVFVERPLSLTAPYTPPVGGLLTPDVFLDPGLGPNNMFLASGLQQAFISRQDTPSITLTPKNFGGAIANSIKGIELAERGFPPELENGVWQDTLFPDYNLDGDRSYAWPCWDITESPSPPQATPVTKTPLRPEATDNDASVQEALASVNPVFA